LAKYIFRIWQNIYSEFGKIYIQDLPKYIPGFGKIYIQDFAYIFKIWQNIYSRIGKIYSRIWQNIYSRFCQIYIQDLAKYISGFGKIYIQDLAKYIFKIWQNIYSRFGEIYFMNRRCPMRVPIFIWENALYPVSSCMNKNHRNNIHHIAIINFIHHKMEHTSICEIYGGILSLKNKPPHIISKDSFDQFAPIIL
jgi:hypothetical protein